MTTMDRISSAASGAIVPVDDWDDSRSLWCHSFGSPFATALLPRVALSRRYCRTPLFCILNCVPYSATLLLPELPVLSTQELINPPPQTG